MEVRPVNLKKFYRSKLNYSFSPIDIRIYQKVMSLHMINFKGDSHEKVYDAFGIRYCWYFI